MVALLLLCTDIYFLYKKTPSSIYMIGDIKKNSSIYETFLPKVDFFVNDKQLKVEVAETQAEQTLGLGKREGLNKNSGMLFIFKNPSKQYFWMKDMKFPIDIVWINQNKKIVGFVEDAKPEDYPETYPSPEGVAYVLEIGSGGVKNYNIKIGDTAIFDTSSLQKMN